MDERQNQQQQGQGGMGQQSQADWGRAAQAENITGESNMGAPAQSGHVSGLGDSDASRGSGQQRGAAMGQEHPQDMQRGSQHGAGQQQQFDSQGRGQQSGGSGTEGSLADRIRPHMDVVDASGSHVGTVDHCDGDRIKLTRSSSPSGKHTYVPMSMVAGIQDGKVCLRQRGDNDFGLEA